MSPLCPQGLEDWNSSSCTGWGQHRVFLEGGDPFTCLGREGYLYAYLQPFALDPGAQLQMLRSGLLGNLCAGSSTLGPF